MFEVNPKNILNKKQIAELDAKDRIRSRESNKRYLDNNPGLSAIYHERYRTKKKALPCSFSLDEWNNTLDYFNNRCAYCGCEKPLAQDHFIAVDNMGEFTINNVVPACKSCNSSKSNKDYFSWYPRYKHYSKTRHNKVMRYLRYKGNTQQLSLIQ